jgi:hypothetical protein
MYTLANNQFKTKSAVKEFYSNILHSYNYGDELIPEDQITVGALFQHHAGLDIKLGGSEVDYFTVMSHMYGNKCFKVHKKDGTNIDFSYINCINNLKK